MTVYLLLAVGAVISWGVWMYTRGGKAAKADVMQGVLDDVAVAAKAREAVDAMPIDDVRRRLSERVRKRPF